MAVDKNLFLYDLAVVAILKNEGHYLKEWLDYHLLAGVEHFYLYDNESTDNQAEVAKPYVEAGLVDYFYLPGQVMQMIAYDDAINRFKFHCRYMAFIDLDEFIFPKNTTGTVTETIDKILSADPNASGLLIHWQIFGSNGHQKADYSRDVLERFTRRAEKDFGNFGNVNNQIFANGNVYIKTITNPRRIKKMRVHNADYFKTYYSVTENAIKVFASQCLKPISVEKIALNHYFGKSREEGELKVRRGRADNGQNWGTGILDLYDRNEVFDDGILKYRAARAEIFSLESDDRRISRVTETLTKILSQYAADEISDLETALTCRAVSSRLQLKLHEEASLAAILKSLDDIKFPEIQLLMSELPNLLSLPYPIVEELKLAVLQIIDQTKDFMLKNKLTDDFLEWNYMSRLLTAWR